MKRLLALCMSFSLLAGCGWPEANEQTSLPEPEIVEEMEEKDPSVPPYFKVEFLPEENYLQEGNMFCPWADRILCCGSGDTPRELFWTDYRGETKTEIPLQLEDQEVIRAMEIAQDGSIYLLLSQQVPVERSIEYGIPYTHQGGRILVVDTFGKKKADFPIYSEDAEFADIVYSAEGYVYLLRCEYEEEEGFFSDHYIDMYNTDGEQVGSLRLADAFPNESRVVSLGFLKTPAGVILVKFQINDYEAVYPLSMVETEYTNPVFSFEEGMGWPRFYSGPGADYYVLDDNLGFLAYSLTDKPKSIFHFNELSSTVPDNAFFVAEIGDYVYLFAVYLDSTCYYFTITGEFEPIPETPKTILTIGSYTEYAGGSILQKATLYNILHPDVELQVKMYSVDENSGQVYVGKDEANEALQLDIIGGEGPDILIMDSYGFSPGIYSGISYLADLTPIMESDNTFTKEDYYYNLWETDTDRVGHIPVTFEIKSVFAAEEIAGDGGWTPTEALALAKETGLPFVRDAGMLKAYVLGEGLSAYMDGSTCCFDDGEFAAMLELMTLTASESETEYFPLKNRHIIAEYADIRQITDFMFAEDQYGPYTIKGVPSPKEEPLSIGISSSIGIAENCSQKEIAWDFIKFMLNTSNSSFMGYALNRGNVMSKLEAALLPEDSPGSPLATTAYGVGNVDLVGRPLTQEDADFIMEQIETASPTMVDVDIIKIVQEECEAFFAGDKSAEEVAELVQSRVMIFLSERS